MKKVLEDIRVLDFRLFAPSVSLAAYYSPSDCLFDYPY